jgi:hypothetical protein
MSGVCLDCPGSHGCCYTYNGPGPDDDEDDEDDRSWQEWLGDVVFQPLMWTVIGCLAFAIAGVLFLIGAFSFSTGLGLLR